jgi:hypothetical protein
MKKFECFYKSFDSSSFKTNMFKNLMWHFFFSSACSINLDFSLKKVEVYELTGSRDYKIFSWKSLSFWILTLVLRPRPQYEYATPSHLTAALNQTSSLDSLSNSSVNRISRFIDHAQILSERTEKWAKDFKRKFYWTIHEEIHFMIFTSWSEDDIKTTSKRIEIDIEAFYLVNRKIQINLDVS